MIKWPPPGPYKHYIRSCAVLLAVLVGLAATIPARAEAPPLGLEDADIYSANDFGGVGLLQTRTARFGQDGQFSVGISLLNPYRRYYLNWQIFPWAEITFRYTDITNIRGRILDQSQVDFFVDFFSFTQGRTFLDRGFDIKFRLAEESKYFPAVAVGLQDFLGTGVFASEYIVLSKRSGNWDFHLGMAWGYLGNRGTLGNPLRLLSDRFDIRSSDFGLGGNLGFKNWFTGRKVGLFGGVEYHTPMEGLSVKVEYSGANTERDPLQNNLHESLPVNVGFNYRVKEWADVSLAWERGNTLLLHVALRYNLHDPGTPKADQGPETGIRPDSPPRKGNDWALETITPPPMTNLDRQLSHFGLKLDKITISGTEARVDITGAEFVDRPDFDARIAYALFDTLPEDVRSARLSLSKSADSKILRRGDWLPQEANLSPEQLTRRIFGGFSFWVHATQHKGNTLEVEVEAPDWARERDYRIAADLVFEQTGKEVETITILASSRIDGIRRFVAYNPYLPLRPEPTLEQTDMQVVDQAAQKLFENLPEHGFRGYALSIRGREATVYVDKLAVRSPGRNLGRVARLATQALPASTDVITVVFVSRKIETARVTVMRKDIEHAAQSAGSPEEISAHATIRDPRASMELPDTTVINKKAQKKFSWGIGPDLRQHVGDPEEGLYKVDVNLNASFNYAFTPNFSISSTVSRFLFGNISDIRRVSNSTLPHVRSDLVEFTKGGRTAISQLKVDYVTKLSKNFYFRASGGILEWMYAGAGIEVLYQQYGSRWALGADVNWVKKRGFKQIFGLQDYDVVTGHFSIYHRFPFYNMSGAVHMGRYLAKDWGATFEIAREFKSGVTVGGFFTLTSVSAEDFGEGSFDKGFFIRIPLDTILMRRSRRTATFLFRPLTRDGGQRVVNGPRLMGYGGLNARNEIRETWRDFMM